MSRTLLQFVVGLALGFLTVLLIGRGGETVEANMIAGAAATMIAPRYWWAGIVALRLGQFAAALLWLSGDGHRIVPAIQFALSNANGPTLFGAIIGAAAWHVADQRRKRCERATTDERPPLH